MWRYQPVQLRIVERTKSTTSNSDDNPDSKDEFVSLRSRTCPRRLDHKRLIIETRMSHTSHFHFSLSTKNCIATSIPQLKRICNIIHARHVHDLHTQIQSSERSQLPNFHKPQISRNSCHLMFNTEKGQWDYAMLHHTYSIMGWHLPTWSLP